MKEKKNKYALRDKIHEIIFEADTPAGKTFDVILLILILFSVIVVMLETIKTLQVEHRTFFYYIEWIFTIIFTIEYILRIYSTRHPKSYIFSFYGIVDLLSIVPTFISIFIVGTQSLLIIRALRLLRVFRIFKLVSFMSQGQMIVNALKNSRQKIAVFMFFVILVVSIFGSIMYLVEAESGGGFDSIPRSIYWAIVTLTTVGYGDISPQTPLGQFLASLVMILGYAVIAVPTGIVTGELIREVKKHEVSTQVCKFCNHDDHMAYAIYCNQCGKPLNPMQRDHDDNQDII